MAMMFDKEEALIIKPYSCISRVQKSINRLPIRCKTIIIYLFLEFTTSDIQKYVNFRIERVPN